MAWIKASQYIFAVSRIRAVENRLLKPETMNRMLDAATWAEAIRVLAEVHYGEQGESISNGDYERLLTEEHKKLYKFMKEIAPDPLIFDLFLQPQDFHNVKVLLKADFADMEELEGLLMDWGSIKTSKLREMIRERDYAEMPSIMRQAVEEAMVDLHHTEDAQTIDIILDRACYKQMQAIAHSYRHSFLRDFVAGTIDLVNISNFFRIKRIKKDMEFIESVMLPGGFIPLKLWLENTEVSAGMLSEAVKYTPFHALVEKMLGNAGAQGRLEDMEQLHNEFRTIFIKKGKDRIDGLEPLLGYLLAKETEIHDVRIIMTGKVNRISKERISERLRGVYA